VLIVRSAIINLDVEAPDTMQAGMNGTVAASAGQMTLYAELYDSVSNQMIGKVMDLILRQIKVSAVSSWPRIGSPTKQRKTGL
jgi:hypothetical protein